ncbi:hypothetical protein KC852_01045 [Candidatus Nomurabacteria bacterium]|nr:hypothetical protein [Candidatus Nomurabacteria bacterium]
MNVGKNLLHETNKKIKKRKQRARNRKIRFFSLLFVLLVLVLLYVSTLPVFYINEIKVEGGEEDTALEVHDFSSEILQKKVLFVLPAANRIFFPRGEVKEDIYESFLQIKKVSFKVRDRVLDIKIEERTKAYLYCQHKEEAGIDCYDVDEEGLVFEKTNQYFNKKIFVDDTKESVAVLGSVVYDGDLFFTTLKYMQVVEDALSINVYGVGKDTNSLSLYLSENLDLGPLLYVDPYADIDNTVIDLVTAAKNDPLKSVLSSDISQVEYIDARFKGKIYFKQK